MGLNKELDDLPIHHKGKSLHISKSYSHQDFASHTVLTDDIFTYVAFYFTTHRKSMKFLEIANKEKYGNAQQFHYEFYWS